MVQSASQVAPLRQEAIDTMISQVRAIAQRDGITRDTLEQIKAEMVQVAKRQALFPLADFSTCRWRARPPAHATPAQG